MESGVDDVVEATEVSAFAEACDSLTSLNLRTVVVVVVVVSTP